MQVWGSDAALERNDTERGEVRGQFLISSWSHSHISNEAKFSRQPHPGNLMSFMWAAVALSGTGFDPARLPPSWKEPIFSTLWRAQGPSLWGNWKFPWSYSRKSAGHPSLNMFCAEEQHISLESMQGETAARRWFIGNAKSSAAERLSCFVAL